MLVVSSLISKLWHLVQNPLRRKLGSLSGCRVTDVKPNVDFCSSVNRALQCRHSWPTVGPSRINFGGAASPKTRRGMMKDVLDPSRIRHATTVFTKRITSVKSSYTTHKNILRLVEQSFKKNIWVSGRSICIGGMNEEWDICLNSGMVHVHIRIDILL